MADVRLWHKTDMLNALMNVRFEGNNGHDAGAMRCLLMTQTDFCVRWLVIRLNVWED